MEIYSKKNLNQLISSYKNTEQREKSHKSPKVIDLKRCCRLEVAGEMKEELIIIEQNLVISRRGVKMLVV